MKTMKMFIRMQILIPTNWKIKLIIFNHEFWVTLLLILKISCLWFPCKAVKMTAVQRLGSMYAIDNGPFQKCYHQCIQCGIIFGCKLVRTANTCGKPFYHGRCNICNGTETWCTICDRVLYRNGVPCKNLRHEVILLTYQDQKPLVLQIVYSQKLKLIS